MARPGVSAPGRSSTAQGLFGAAGTLGFIAASLVAGALASVNILFPFYLMSAVMVATLVLGVLIGRDRLNLRPVPPALATPPASEAAGEGV